LRSPKVIHIVLKRQFKDFVKQLFFSHPLSSYLDFVRPPRFGKGHTFLFPPFFATAKAGSKLSFLYFQYSNMTFQVLVTKKSIID